MKSIFLRVRHTLQAARALWGNLNPLKRGPLSFEQAQRPGLWPPPVFRAGRWLADDEHRSHWAISGASCSGKGLLLALYLRSIVPQLTPGSDRRLVLFDSDNYLHRSLFDDAQVPVHYLLPGHRLTSRWDLAGGDFATPGAVMRLCQALVPEAQGDYGSTFFDQACRGLMGGVIRSLNATQPGWSLTDVIRTLDDRDSTAEVLARGDETRSLLRYMDEPRTYAAIAATMQAHLDPLRDLALMWSRASQVFSLRDFQKEGILVLGCDPRLPALGLLNMLLFTELFSELLAQGESSSSRTFLVFDDLTADAIRPLPGLKDVLLQGRSRGVVVTATFRSDVQIKESYNAEADPILDLFKERVFLRAPDYPAAECASQAFRKWHQRIDVSGEHRASHAADIIPPEKFLSLPFATPKDGITGYRLSPHARGGRHTFHLPWRWIEANLPKGGNGDAPEA